MSELSGPRSVFVYGTLKPGGHYWPAFCEGRVQRVTPARVRGRLFDLPLGYPALLIDPPVDWVEGVLLWADPFDRFLAGLDRLEGFDPNRPAEANEYLRTVVTVYPLDQDQPLGRAWTYVMDEQRVKKLGGRWLPGGVWPATRPPE